jgi:hypothetical protein
MPGRKAPDAAQLRRGCHLLDPTYAGSCPRLGDGQKTKLPWLRQVVKGYRETRRIQKLDYTQLKVTRSVFFFYFLRVLLF